MLTRSGAQIAIDGDVVLKLHRDSTDPRALRRRLQIAAATEQFVSPLSRAAERIGSRWQTSWPRMETLRPEPDQAPWAQAGALLAALHTQPVLGRVPAHGWPLRLRRTVRRLGPGATPVHRAAAALPEVAWRAGSPGRPRVLVHGDWHLGQLARRGPDAPWQLIDIDDVGLGDPLWDLARPGGFWAVGLIPDEHWSAFLDAYRAGAGPALDAGEPWPLLEPFARAAVVHAAAAGIIHGDEDDTQCALMAACARMTD